MEKEGGRKGEEATERMMLDVEGCIAATGLPDLGTHGSGFRV